MKKEGKSSGGILFGLLLLIGGICLLWWNEGRTVKTASAIKEVNSAVVDVSSNEVNSQYEGKVVTTNGQATYDNVVDQDFGVNINALVLNRSVEMYQWTENCDSDNDCTYNKSWESSIVSSAGFQSGHTNPTSMLYDSAAYYATNVKLGAFIIPSDFLTDLTSTKDYQELVDIPEGFHYQNGYYVNTKGDSPEIGDLRISFKYNDSKELTVLGVQTSNTFKPYVAKSGVSISLLADGLLESTEMVKILNDQNNATKWMFRLIGTIMVIMAVTMIISPLTKLLGYIPLLGNVVNSVLFFITALLGFALSLLVIAIAWFRYRPVLSLILVIIIAAAIVLVEILAKKKKAPETVNS